MYLETNAWYVEGVYQICYIYYLNFYILLVIVTDGLYHCYNIGENTGGGQDGEDGRRIPEPREFYHTRTKD